MIDTEELMRKMNELEELMKNIKKENVPQEIFEISYKYRYEIISCRNFISKLDIHRLTSNQFLLLKRAKDNIENIYRFKDYMYKLSLEKETI